MKNGIIIILIIGCIAFMILGITGQFKLTDKKKEIQEVNSLLKEYIEIIPLADKQLELSKKMNKILEENWELMQEETPENKERRKENTRKCYFLSLEILELGKQKLKLYEEIEQ